MDSLSLNERCGRYQQSVKWRGFCVRFCVPCCGETPFHQSAGVAWKCSKTRTKARLAPGTILQPTIFCIFARDRVNKSLIKKQDPSSVIGSSPVGQKKRKLLQWPSSRSFSRRFPGRSFAKYGPTTLVPKVSVLSKQAISLHTFALPYLDCLTTATGARLAPLPALGSVFLRFSRFAKLTLLKSPRERSACAARRSWRKNLKELIFLQTFLRLFPPVPHSNRGGGSLEQISG